MRSLCAPFTDLSSRRIGLYEGAIVVLAECQPQFLRGVHHDGPLPGNMLPKGPSRNQQEPQRFVTAGHHDLVVFANRDDLPPVLQASIAHAQFETIHPFWDGNGRVGRALIHAILRRRGLAPRYVPPVSLALAGRADDYIRGLTAYRYGDEEDWYAIFADALRASAAGARDFAGRVATLQDRWLKQAGNPRRGAGARKLIDALPAHPVVDVRTAQDVLGARSQETARAAIIRLVSAGVLREVKIGRKRGRLWESVGLFDLLDSFERELGPIGRAPSASKP